MFAFQHQTKCNGKTGNYVFDRCIHTLLSKMCGLLQMHEYVINENVVDGETTAIATTVREKNCLPEKFQ